MPFQWWRICATTQRATKIFLPADQPADVSMLSMKVDYNAINYAEIIKAYRKIHNIKQIDLALILKVNQFTLRSWEQAKATPPYHVWRLFKDLFDYPANLS